MIRVLFPDGVVVECNFVPSDTVADVRQVIRQCLADPSLPFHFCEWPAAGQQSRDADLPLGRPRGNPAGGKLSSQRGSPEEPCALSSRRVGALRADTCMPCMPTAFQSCSACCRSCVRALLRRCPLRSHSAPQEEDSGRDARPVYGRARSRRAHLLCAGRTHSTPALLRFVRLVLLPAVCL